MALAGELGGAEILRKLLEPLGTVGQRYDGIVTALKSHALSGDIGDFGRARAVRRKTVLTLTMSERLARLHALCKQMSAIKGAASAR